MVKVPFKSKMKFKEVNAFVENIENLVNEDNNPIYIDMGPCQFLNSFMLSGLIRALLYCQANNTKLVLSKVHPSVITLFETTNVLSLFIIEDRQELEEDLETLDVSFRKENNDTGILLIKGNLNKPGQYSQFRAFYEKYIDECSNIILDCSSLEHLGSQGVTELFRLRGILQEKNGMLIMVSEGDSIDSIWQMMHLETLIPKSPSLEEAFNLL